MTSALLLLISEPLVELLELLAHSCKFSSIPSPAKGREVYQEVLEAWNRWENAVRKYKTNSKGPDFMNKPDAKIRTTTSCHRSAKIQLLLSTSCNWWQEESSGCSPGIPSTTSSSNGSIRKTRTVIRKRCHSSSFQWRDWKWVCWEVSKGLRLKRQNFWGKKTLKRFMRRCLRMKGLRRSRPWESETVLLMKRRMTAYWERRCKGTSWSDKWLWKFVSDSEHKQMNINK